MTRSSRRRRETRAARAEPESARGRGAPPAGRSPVGIATAARTEWGAVALVLAAAAWLQRGALSFGFFADDFLFLDQVRERTLIAALLSRDPLGNFLRPLSRQAHFWLASRIAGESPVPFHLANLLYFLVALVLFQRIARRWIGPAAAVVAMAILSLSYTADVPMLWASGSQDLMALTLALAALLLHQRGNRAWAALAYGLALLCKETVLLTPLVAWLIDSEASRTRRLRNLLPMAIAAVLWVGVWVATASLRPAAATTLHADLGLVPAALLHLVQCAFAFEWGAVGLSEAWSWPSLAPLAALIAAVLWTSSLAAPPRSSGDSRRAALLAGLGWAACGALPVAAVAPIWSAYYYLFAICGVALALGAALVRGSRIVQVAMLVFLAALNARASSRREFATAPGAWTTQSHVTRFYLERSERIRSQLLSDLRRERPTLPRNSTLFFASVPSNIGWQAGDGPLVRWAYRDTSLKSYFLNQFSYTRAQRGPVFFFNISDEHLVEMWKDESPYGALALNMILDDHPESARDAMRMLDEGKGLGRFERYMTVWLEVDAGRTDSARAQLLHLDNGVEAGPAPEVAQALRMVQARGDTLQAIALISEGLRHHPFDPAAHGLMSDLLLIRHLLLPTAQIEAYAARVLAPDVPWSWRRWAEVQLATQRSRQGAFSLDRYFQLAGSEGDSDTEAHYWRDQLQRVLPGGDLAQQSLSGKPKASGAFEPAPPGRP